MAVRVLIVEDNAVARTFLCRVVRDSFSDEVEIAEAADLDTARRLLGLAGDAATGAGGAPFKLMLLDLELPDGSGQDLLCGLAHYPALKIVTTLYSDDEHLFPALRAGADGFLLKEDRYEVLVEDLQRIVCGQPPISASLARRLLAHFRHSGDRPSRFGDSAFGQTAAGQFGTPEEHERLTAREAEVLTYLSKGFTLKEIASLTGSKWFAINDHIKAIYRKLSASSADPRGETSYVA